MSSSNFADSEPISGYKTGSLYELKVIIHSGSNLPVGDITTSDPFVVVSLDERILGRTPTIEKNLNPIWETSFEKMGLLGIQNSILQLRIYDEDKNSDDMLGVINIALRDLIQKSCQLYESPLEQSGSMNSIIARGTIKYSILLERNDNIVKIIPFLKFQNENIASSDSSIEAVEKFFTSCLTEKLNRVECEPIIEVLRSYYLESNSDTLHNQMTRDQISLIGDFISDIGSMLALSPNQSEVKTTDQGMLDYLMECSIKQTPHYVSSTKIELSNPIASKKYSRYSPLPFVGLLLILEEESDMWSGNDSTTNLYYLKLANKHVMWAMTKWLQLAFDIWHNVMDIQNLPSWAESCGGIFQCSASLSQTLESKETDNDPQEKTSEPPKVAQTSTQTVSDWKGSVEFSLSKPFQLRVCDPVTKLPIFNLKLHTLKSIVMTWDCSRTASHTLELDIGASTQGDPQNNLFRPSSYSVRSSSGNPSPNNDPDAKYGPKGLIGFRRFVRKRADIIKTTLQTTVTDSAIGVASTALETAGNVARSIKTGDAAASLSAAQTTVLTAGKGIADLVTSTGSTLVGIARVVTYVIVKYGSITQKAFVQTSALDLNSWDCQVAIDVTLSEKNETKFFPTLAEIRRLKIDSAKHGTSSTDRGIDIFMFHGIEGMEELIAQKHLKISKLFPTIREDHDNTSCNILRSDVEITLDAELGLRVTLMSAKGLQVAQKKSSLITVTGPSGIYVKCKFSNVDGDSIDSLPGQRSPTVKLVSNPDWGEEGCDMFFAAKDGYQQAQYMRLKITGGGGSLGVVFIPIEDFSKTSTERTYPVLKDKSMSGVGYEGMGEICVRIRKIDEKMSLPSKAIKLKLRATLRESSPYNALWPSESSLVGSLEAESSMEKHIFAPSFDALLFLDKNALAFVSGTENDSASVSGDYNPSSESFACKLLPDVVFEVFENQRRSAFPPFLNWGHANLMPNLPGERSSQFSDETGSITYPYPTLQEIPPPDGFEWLTNDYCLDKSYTQTDEMGWSYGIDFNYIAANFKKGKSTTTIQGRSARRRKWTRIARQPCPPGMPIEVYESRNLQLRGRKSSSNISLRTATVTSIEESPTMSARSNSGKSVAFEEFPADEGNESGSTRRLSNASTSDLQGTLNKRASKRLSSIEPNEPQLISVFENQRRCILPPYDWGDGNLLLNDVPHFSDIQGSQAFPFETLVDAIPPPGYEWDTTGKDTWKLDKQYTQTDNDGWSYGIHFTYILSNYLKGKSTTSGVGRATRRRKWTRLAKPTTLTFTNSEDLMDDSSSNPFQSGGMNRSTSMKSVILYSDLTWRAKAIISGELNKDSIVCLCQERASADLPTIIPWSQVLNASIISPSILNVEIIVHRYFASEKLIDKKSVKIESFREAKVEIFVFNCLSYELKTLIEERIQFAKIRENMKTLIKSGNLTGKPSSRSSQASAANPDFPETSDLSLGSATAADLDSDILALGSRLSEIKDYIQYLNLSNSEAIYDECHNYDVVARRYCRLQLYSITLLLANLQGYHDYSEDEANRILNNDFSTLALIVQDDEISTANNKIEFLLDTAEVRLRDASLCGWAHRGQALERMMECLVNGYFFEMVALLAKYFDKNNPDMTSLQGLQSKVNLITTFMKHNDRLDILLSSALRPYNVCAEPPPQLSVFLHFDSLISWYTIVLQEEMRNVVNNALHVWKDLDKNASGYADRYKHPLPWIPLRQGGDSGIFRTLMPEDAIGYLDRYLEYAKLGNDEVAPSFRSLIWKVDAKVNQSYASSFVHLAGSYWSELCAKDWSDIANATSEESAFEQLEEASEWLCSVANDARRIVNEAVITDAIGLSKTTKEEANKDNEKQSALEAIYELIEDSNSIFSICLDRAMDFLACIMFRELSRAEPNEIGFLDNGFFLKWEEDANQHRYLLSEAQAGTDEQDDEESTNRTECLFVQHLEQLESLLESQIDNLDPYCYFKFLCCSAEKVVIRYFGLLKDAAYAGRKYAHNGIQAHVMSLDVITIKLVFDRLIGKSKIKEYQDSIRSIFKPLDQALAIIQSEQSTSKELESTFNSIHKVASGQPQIALSRANFLSTCLSLRLKDKKYSLINPPTAPPSPLNSVPAPTSPIKRSSLIGSMFIGVTSQLAIPHTNSPYPEENHLTSEIDNEDIKLVHLITDLQGISESVNYNDKILWDFQSLGPILKAFDIYDLQHHTVTLPDLILKSASPLFHVKSLTAQKATGKMTSIMNSFFASTSLVSEPPSKGANAAIMMTKEEMRRGINSDTNLEYSIVVNAIKVFNLFSLSYSRPTSYLKITLGSNHLISSDKINSSDPDWSSEPNFEFHVPQSFALSGQDSNLVLEILYKNYFRGDDLVGSVKISLASIDLAPIKGASFQFVINSVSQIQTAATKSSDSGKPKPSVQLSIRLHKNSI